MNEESMEIVSPDEGDVLAVEDTGTEVVETFEGTIVEVVDLDRPFMTTPFSEYSVSEGLLLLIVLLTVIQMCMRIIKGGFWWL